MMIAAISAANAVIQRGRTELAHFAPVGREHDQRHDRERQLQAQHHLAEDQQLARCRSRRTRS